MNAPRDPSDPLLQSLTDEAADLPSRAAAAARQRSAQRRQNRQLLTYAAILAVLGSVTWSSYTSRDTGSSTAQTGLPAGPPEPSGVAGLPAGLSEDQQRFILASPDLPLLLVRDASGKVARIHLVER